MWNDINKYEPFGISLTPPVSITLRGLTPSESRNILRHAGCRLWALSIPILLDNVDETFRVIRQCVEAGLPTMLHVHFTKLYSNQFERDLVGDYEQGEERREEDNRHAILLIGTGSTPEGQPTFVYHDPWAGPYMEVTEETLTARDENGESAILWFETQGESDPKRGMAIVACPREVRCSPMPCHLHIFNPEPEKTDVKATALDESNCESLDWKAELVSKSHLIRRMVRLMTASFTPVDRIGQEKLRLHLKEKFPNNPGENEKKIPAYAWVFTRRADPIGTADPQPTPEWGYIYDATPEVQWPGSAESSAEEGNDRASNADVKLTASRLGRFYTKYIDGRKYVFFQEGIKGFITRVHQYEDKEHNERHLIVEALDPDGKLIPRRNP
jgi:hypothetical protein